MKHKWLFWLPRVLAILFIVFISIFALDVFGEYGFPEILVALFMHLIPSFVLIGILLAAWKWELYGGTAFIIAGLGFIWFFNTYRHILNFFLISFPVLVIGFLFILDYFYKKK